MKDKKESTITFRISTNLKDALISACEREQRSISNMIKVLIRNHCSEKGIKIEGDEKYK